LIRTKTRFFAESKGTIALRRARERRHAAEAPGHIDDREERARLGHEAVYG
jgi:hypothetical protein